MNADDDTARRVRAALECDVGVNLHRYPIDVSFHDGVLTLEGDVEDVVTKKRAWHIARRMDGVQECVDRLRVLPTERRGDGEIRDVLIDVLMQDTAFHDCTKRTRVIEGGEFAQWQEAHREPSGLLEITVNDGVITLEGHVPSPSHKRLAEAIAWWVRGCRDVVNRLEVIPPRDDTDDEITDALYLVLEKDPLVKADQLRVATCDRVVTLEGLLTNEMEKKAAEADAWCLTGIEEVVNKIQVPRAET